MDELLNKLKNESKSTDSKLPNKGVGTTMPPKIKVPVSKNNMEFSAPKAFESIILLLI